MSLQNSERSCCTLHHVWRIILRSCSTFMAVVSGHDLSRAYIIVGKQWLFPDLSNYLEESLGPVYLTSERITCFSIDVDAAKIRVQVVWAGTNLWLGSHDYLSLLLNSDRSSDWNGGYLPLCYSTENFNMIKKTLTKCERLRLDRTKVGSKLR